MVRQFWLCSEHPPRPRDTSQSQCWTRDQQLPLIPQTRADLSLAQPARVSQSVSVHQCWETPPAPGSSLQRASKKPPSATGDPEVVTGVLGNWS